MSRTIAKLSASLLVLALGVGCSYPRSQVVIALTVDDNVAQRVHHFSVRLYLWSRERGALRAQTEFAPSNVASWPALTAVVANKRDVQAEYLAEAIAYADASEDTLLSTARTISSFVPGRTLRVPMHLFANCDCAGDQVTCSENGQCVSAVIAPSSLQDFVPDAGGDVQDSAIPVRDDGAVADAHAMDANVPPMDADADVGDTELAQDSTVDLGSFDVALEVAPEVAIRDAELDGFVSFGPVRSLALGGGHLCALYDTGDVRCRGWNRFGQLGNGTTIDSPVPVLVSLPSRAVQVATGGFTTCALLENSSIYCWGRNAEGAVGDGTTQDRSLPVRIAPILSEATELALGESHSCLRLLTGEVYCWGKNDTGQLADGTQTRRLIPTLTLIEDALSVSAGNFHTCVVTFDRTVKCAGYNASSQLGVPALSSTDSRSTPVIVPDLGSVVGVTANGWHSCAVTRDSRLFCWGGNSDGQLGIGSRANAAPSMVNLPNTSHHALGVRHTCAVSNGSVYCWGQNNNRQLGIPGSGALLPQRIGAESVPELGDLFANSSTTCTRINRDTLRCWGSNEHSQLGAGAMIYPAPAPSLW